MGSHGSCPSIISVFSTATHICSCFLRTQCGELVAEVVAYKTENKKLQSSIEEDRQAMSAADEKVQKVKQSFLQSSSQFNADIRCSSWLQVDPG